MIDSKIKNMMSIKTLKRKFNFIGFAIILSVLIQYALTFGYTYLLENYPVYFEIYTKLALDTIFNVLLLVLTFAFPFMIAQFLLRIRFTELFKKSKIDVANRMGYVAIGISIYLIVNFIANALAMQFGFTMPAMVDLKFQSNNMLSYILYLIYFILCIPLLEEYIFRGVLLRCFGLVGAKFAMIASAMVYTLMYLGKQEPVLSFVIGMFLAYVAMIDGSVWTVVAVRIGIHIIMIVGLFIPTEVGWIMGLLAAIIYAAAIYSIYSTRNHKAVLNESISLKEAWIYFFTSWCMVISLILLILRSFYYILL